MMQLVPAGLVAALVWALCGCGQLGADYKGVRLVPARSVRQQTIERYRAGTPARAVLEWFRAIQQGDAGKALPFYAANVQITPVAIRFERAAGSRYFAQAQPPRVIRVVKAARRATVFTVVDFRWAAPDGRGFVYMRPQAFELQRSRGAWQLTDNYFLESTLQLTPTGPCPTC